MKANPILFVDVETTGLDPRTDRIIEVAFVLFDTSTLTTLYVYEALIEGGREILSTFNEPHFRDADWNDAVPLTQALRRFGEMAEDRTLAGWNPQFDQAFLRAEHDRTPGMHWPHVDYHVIGCDSYCHILHALGLTPGIKLEHGRAWAGIKEPQAHRALPDALDAAQFYWRFRKTVDPMFTLVPRWLL